MKRNRLKYSQFQDFIVSLKKCNKCTEMKCREKSLINFYGDYEFSTNIPSIWTDWFNRLDSEIMIIGQDWGPYNDMRRVHDLLNEDKSNWKEVIELEKSSTKKMLGYYIEKSLGDKYLLNDIFITNAIMCARRGNNYRGNNISLCRSSINCCENLLRQIEIVKPKIILTLGYYPLKSLSIVFGFNICSTLMETINKYPEIVINDYIIIPLYHPVAQIKKSIQLEQYNRITKYIN